MAVTNQQIIDYLLANPNLSDAQIAATMQEFSVTPAQLAQAVNLPTEVVQERYVVAAPNTNTTENINKLASQILSQGTTEAWTGGLPPEKAALYMASDLAKSGVTNIEQIAKGDSGIVNTMTGEKLVSGYGERTGGNLWSGSYEGKGNTGFGVNFDEQGKPVFYSQGASSSTLKKDVLKLAAVAGAVYGLGGFGAEGLLSGAGTAGMSAAELAQLDLALGGAGGTAGATSLGNALATGANVGTLTNQTGGSGLFGGADVTTNTARELAAANATTPTSLTSAAVTPVAGAVTPAATSSGLLSTSLPAAGTLGGALTSGALSTLGGAAASGLLGSAITGGLGLAGGVLQQQQSREAAQTAAQNVDRATQQAVEASQFRPVGMTTRFGTSNYTYDPVTGRMTSAGYQLSPDAKAAQDRLVALAGQGLTQAEAAQAQFAPLQTGAQNLFGLGNQYISQSPQDVAQNYINQQMALLQPSREVELANLQNRLQQQGRGGLSVAQGGSLGATTPELQALYNARAQQEAILAANAQQAGQQNVLFGAGLLGQGAQAMGNYYGGQTQAYAPYTTALGQVQNLESLAQQPLQMGASLGQQSATAGANAGRLGLTGAQISGNLMTSPAVTNNPYAAFLSGLGSPTSTLGQGLANWVTGTGYAPPSLFSAVGGGGFGTGNVFGNQDLGSYL